MRVLAHIKNVLVVWLKCFETALVATFVPSLAAEMTEDVDEGDIPRCRSCGARMWEDE